MVEPRTRDRIWNAALELAKESGDRGFQVHEVSRSIREETGEAPADRTIREVLNVMNEYGWLSKKGGGPKKTRYTLAGR